MALTSKSWNSSASRAGTEFKISKRLHWFKSGCSKNQWVVKIKASHRINFSNVFSSGTEEFHWEMMALSCKSWVNSTSWAGTESKMSSMLLLILIWLLCISMMTRWVLKKPKPRIRINFECSGMSIRKKECF